MWLNASLVNNSQIFEASEYLTQFDIIGLLFSAKWCDPCVKFEDTLAMCHKSVITKGGSFGIIVVSDDKDEDEFEEHLSKNHWTALQYSDYRIKKQLKHRYHVTGLPKLVIIEAQTGRVLNSDAKSNVEIDAEGAGFPWAEPSVTDLLKGPVLFQGKTVDLEETLKAKTVLGLYFSADWCPPCRHFSPTLTSLHGGLKENGFEVLYCSLDKIEEKFLSTSQAMPWPSFAFKDDRVKLLAKALLVEDIPQLVVWDLKRQAVINRNAVSRIRQDPAGEQFPWRPEQVTVLTMGNISEMSCQIVFLFIAATMEEVQVILPDMTLVAKNFSDYRFYAASDEDPVVLQLREILQVGDQCPYLLFLDFESRTWARSPQRLPGAAHLEPFVRAVAAGEVDLTDFPPSD